MCLTLKVLSSHIYVTRYPWIHYACSRAGRRTERNAARYTKVHIWMNVTLSLWQQPIFFSLISFRCNSQPWLLLPQRLPFPLASRIHCQACQSAQPLPPCPVNCRQVIALTLFSPPTHICNSIGDLKYFVFSEFLSHHVNVLPPSFFQVCPQYPCSPPPPAPPSTPSHLWIPPPPASTPPPRYQVGAF